VHRRSTKGQSPRVQEAWQSRVTRRPGTRLSDPSRSSAHSRAPKRVQLAATLAGVMTERICRSGTWPSPCLLHVCSDVALLSDSARYQAAAKWAESRLLIRGFGVRVPGGAPVLTWGFIAQGHFFMRPVCPYVCSMFAPAHGPSTGGLVTSGPVRCCSHRSTHSPVVRAASGSAGIRSRARACWAVFLVGKPPRLMRRRWPSSPAGSSRDRYQVPGPGFPRCGQRLPRRHRGLTRRVAAPPDPPAPHVQPGRQLQAHIPAPMPPARRQPRARPAILPARHRIQAPAPPEQRPLTSHDHHLCIHASLLDFLQHR
jgi:hypothetical protein